jgi:ABC-type transporter Mla subunit MlaD
MSSTNTFVETLKQTPPLSAALQQNLQRLKDDDDEIIKVLTYTKTVSDDLDKLDDALTTANQILTFVSVIPEVGEAAAALKESIAVLSQEVSPARKAADQLEAKVKPLRDALGKLSSGLDDAIQATAKINSTSQAFLDKFTAVVNCINSLPDGDYKTKGLQYLDQFSSALQPVVATLNTALSTANDVIGGFYSELTKIKAALNPLGAIADAVQQVLSVLDPLMGPLQELEDKLNTIEIPVPIPYPHMVSLHDVFQFFSAFADIIESAMAPIQDLLNDLLNALHITLPSIPGLSDLINLDIDIPAIPDLSGLLLAIRKPFDQFNLKIPTFSLKCPPAPGDVVPVWTGN